MSAKFFSKKIWSVLSVVSVFFLLVYSLNLSKVQSIGQSKTFYFLVSNETNVEVGVEFSKLDGGAGYLLEYDGKEYVAWSVYDSEEKGKNVQRALREDGKDLLLVKIGGKSLYLNKNKRHFNGLRLLENYISFLDECVYRLERGMTQESCKRTLRILQRQLEYAHKSQEMAQECSALFQEVEGELVSILEKQVYAKDLRYLLCRLANGYISLTNQQI